MSSEMEPPSRSLNELFAGLHDQVACELGVARSAVGHAATKGTVTENRWIDMMRKHLPERYCVNRAFVIDSKSVVSRQQDIVIHDRQYSPFVLNLGDALYVPSESVYAVLEVKQSLSSDEIKDAAVKIESVRKLHRTSMPIRHAGGEYPAKPLHHILGGIVALESDWNPPFGDAFRAAISAASQDGRIDIGCAVKHGNFGIKYASGDPPAVAVEMSKSSLALFLLRLIASLQDIATVPCIDVRAYAANIEGNLG